MKVSQILKGALKSHYVQEDDGSKPGGVSVSVFMCHAGEYYLDTMTHLGRYERRELRQKVIEAFMPTIESENTNCLAVYLYRTSRMYRFRYDCSEDHSSKTCFNLRVKWWKKLIIKLESEGN